MRTPPSEWRNFAFRQRAAPPLRFVSGIRHLVKSGVCCRVHSHPAAEIVYHRSGSGVTRLAEGSARRFHPHTAVIYGPHVPHDQVMDSPGEDLCVQIAIPDADGTRLDSTLVVPDVDEPLLVEEILALSGCPASDDPLAQAVLDFRATSVLLALLHRESAAAVRSSNREQPGSAHVRAAEEYIRQHFATIGSLEEVATRVGVSLDHLRHLYRRERNRTLVSHLGAVRIGRAKFLLRNTGLPLKQIAAMTGFRNEHYFSTVFRRAVERTPAAYRRRG